MNPLFRFSCNSLMYKDSSKSVSGNTCWRRLRIEFSIDRRGSVCRDYCYHNQIKRLSRIANGCAHERNVRFPPRGRSGGLERSPSRGGGPEPRAQPRRTIRSATNPAASQPPRAACSPHPPRSTRGASHHVERIVNSRASGNREAFMSNWIRTPLARGGKPPLSPAPRPRTRSREDKRAADRTGDRPAPRTRSRGGQASGGSDRRSTGSPHPLARGTRLEVPAACSEPAPQKTMRQ